MLTDEQKSMLAWALDCTLTQRDKVGILKIASVMKAVNEARQHPEIVERVVSLIEALDPLRGADVRRFMKQHRK